MPPVISITDRLTRLTPGPQVTVALTVIGLGIAVGAWHITRGNDHAVATLRHETVFARRITLQRKNAWHRLAARVARYGHQPTQSIATTVPLALGAFEHAAVICGAPLSSITSTAQGAMYAMNPRHVAQPIPWAPGVLAVTFVAQGQWSTLAGLQCLVRSLRHRPVAIGAMDINATAYTVVLEVLGDK